MFPRTVLTPLSDAKALLLDALPAPVPQVLPLGEAAGLVAAETIRANGPVPAHAIAQRRGVAVTASELVGASPYAPVILPVPPQAVLPGDLLAASRDAVLPPDAVTAAGPFHEVGQSAYPGEGAILPGADLAPGSVIVRAGETLSPAILLALRLAGFDAIPVLVPAIAVTAPDADAGALPDVEWLRAALVGMGCRVTEAGSADLIVRVTRDIDGSASAEASRSTTRISGLAISPGGEAAIEVGGPRPVVSMAPRFDAMAGVLLALILPLVAARTGRGLRRVTRPLTRKLVSQVGFTDIALLRDTGDGYEPLAVGRAPLAALLAADAAAIIDPGSEGAPAGTPLDATPLREPFEPK
jgi:molybdopterin biosynthesis enzyme